MLSFMKKTLLMIMVVSVSTVLADIVEEKKSEATDITTFLALSGEVALEREKRLVTIEEFNAMSNDTNTLILDSRSAKAFQEAHIKGAINIDFSDFTEEKLAAVIPDKKTRILIYCNNNFISEMTSLLDKSLPLALNIPTFINLYGYGYKNVYELKDRIPDVDDRVELMGEFQKPEKERE